MMRHCKRLNPLPVLLKDFVFFEFARLRTPDKARVPALGKAGAFGFRPFSLSCFPGSKIVLLYRLGSVSTPPI